MSLVVAIKVAQKNHTRSSSATPNIFTLLQHACCAVPSCEGALLLSQTMPNGQGQTAHYPSTLVCCRKIGVGP